MSDALESLPCTYPRRFVPRALQVRTFDDVEPLYRRLAETEVTDVETLERWLRDRSELESVIGEQGSRLHIGSSIDTTNEVAKRALLDWVTAFIPRLSPWADVLDRKFRDAPARAALDPRHYGIYERSVLTRLELYRDENVSLNAEVARLVNQYHGILGAATVEFEGKRHTPQQMYKFQQSPDRDLRERAWRAKTAREYADRERLADLYEQQLRAREKIAQNAGCSDFRDYSWKAYPRFDYSPEDCNDFADAVEQTVLPALRRIYERRRKFLGVERLRPWDQVVDPEGKPALRPFDDVEQLKSGCGRIFHGIDPQLGAQFDRMRLLGLLELANREGKAQGGYQCTLWEARLPFIFMNAVGIDGDIRTLLHESGHAFHTFAAADQPIIAYRRAPTEFGEVASMSMEFLGLAHLAEFYKAEDVRRSTFQHFENALALFVNIALGDQFQHWVYTHPGHDGAARNAAWARIDRRFERGIDHSGVEHYRDSRWVHIGHFFWAPFYFIEYAIAQIGALQVWMNARTDRNATLARYREALCLGGSKGLRDLFKAAGLTFGMNAKTLAPLVRAIEEELERLA